MSKYILESTNDTDLSGCNDDGIDRPAENFSCHCNLEAAHNDVVRALVAHGTAVWINSWRERRSTGSCSISVSRRKDDGAMYEHDGRE